MVAIRRIGDLPKTNAIIWGFMTIGSNPRHPTNVPKYKVMKLVTSFPPSSIVGK